MRNGCAIALACVLGFTTLGCTTTQQMWSEWDIADEAETAVEEYVRDLRWGRVPNAAARVEPLKRPEFVAFFRNGHPFHFTDSAVDAVAFDPEERVATAVVRFTLFRLPGVTEIQVAEVQQWRYDRATGAWYVDPDLEVFRNAGVR